MFFFCEERRAAWLQSLCPDTPPFPEGDRVTALCTAVVFTTYPMFLLFILLLLFQLSSLLKQLILQTQNCSK